MNMWKICALAILMAFTPAYAGVVDGKASIDYWYVQGDVNQTNNTNSNANLADNHSLDKKGSAQMSVSLEHAVPLVPNVEIRHTRINQQASNGVETSDVNVGSTDLILYYDVLDHIIKTDVGLALKRIDGDINVNGGESVNVSKTMPMLYVAAGAKLPFTGLSANLQALATSYDDAKGVDVKAEVKYNVIEKLLYDVGAKIGYRMLDIKLDDKNGIDQKLKFHGPFVGIEMGF